MPLSAAGHAQATYPFHNPGATAVYDGACGHPRDEISNLAADP
jgi:hypothetical protein